jgi:Lrp/AsnC family leucine-responsive transcriptional regulator
MSLDELDSRIANIIQKNSRVSSAEIGKAVGVSASTANERVRRLNSSGVIDGWRCVLNPQKIGANLCALLLVDMDYQGEAEAVNTLAKYSEVQELHHISGAHSYLLKIRVADTDGLHSFLQNKVKPLIAVTKTESMIVLDTLKETTEILISPDQQDESDDEA